MSALHPHASADVRAHQDFDADASSLQGRADPAVLAEVDVPCAAVVYVDDPFVEFGLSLETAALVPTLRPWIIARSASESTCTLASASPRGNRVTSVTAPPRQWTRPVGALSGGFSSVPARQQLRRSRQQAVGRQFLSTSNSLLFLAARC